VIRAAKKLNNGQKISATYQPCTKLSVSQSKSRPSSGGFSSWSTTMFV